MADALKSSIQALAEGRIILLVDDVAIRQTCYLVMAAEFVTPDAVSFMVNHGRGVICAAVSEERLKTLQIPMMPRSGQELNPDLAVSVEARQGVTTGISAADRAKTLHSLATTTDSKFELVTPGHIFPVRAKTGGVLVRGAIGEAAVDLLQIAKLKPVAAYTHCLDQYGEIIDGAEISEIQKELGLSSISISEIIRRRLETNSIVEKVAEAELPTRYAGNFRAIAFRSISDDAEHLALVKGEIDCNDETGKQMPVLVRVQAENRVGDLLSNHSVFRRPLIHGALKKIAAEGRGVFIYVRHPRKGTLLEQVRSLGRDTFTRQSSVPSQLRELGVGAQILNKLGAQRLRILTNSKREIAGVEAFHLEIVEREPFEPFIAQYEPHTS